MGYRQQMRSNRNTGRGRDRSKRKRSKRKREKQEPSDGFFSEKSGAPDLVDVAVKTLARLHSLGNQTFGLFPFSDYFDDWLLNLKGVVSDFATSSGLDEEDEFVEESSRIISNVEQSLGERRRNEGVYTVAIQSISTNKNLLSRLDKEYVTKTMELDARRKREIDQLSNKVHALEHELSRISQMKTGFFRSVSKKAKAQQEADTNQSLISAKMELESAERNFAAEQERLQKECEEVKRPVLEQMQSLQDEVENLDIDGSLQARQATCDALADSINALLQRKK